MSLLSIWLPLFFQVGLTFFLMFWMARARFAAVRQGDVKLADLKSDWNSWPERPTQIAAAYRNQLELPLLFYVAVLTSVFTAQTDTIMVALAWLFVAARIIHAYVHTGHNDIHVRFRAFTLGAVVLMMMWLYLLLKLLVGL